MKRLLIYLPLLLLVACVPENMPADETEQTSSEMSFIPRALSLTRASSSGLYNRTEYPVDRIYLTAYHRDNLDYTQWYFRDIKLDYHSDSTPWWSATQWYWPLQGKMEFLSYWSPKVFGSPEFYEYTHANGSKAAQMVVNARGKAASGTDPGYAGLDGYTDFLYIAQNNIDCPRSNPLALYYKHGLAWITLSLRAEVLNAEGQPDKGKTDELIAKIHINRIVIEDVSRKGTAYLVPGLDAAWTIEPEDIKDQVYFRPEGHDAIRGTFCYYTWEEFDDASTTVMSDYITLSDKKQYLGLYTPSLYAGDESQYNPDNHEMEYIGNGLLLIPQHKTAITVYYTVLNGRLKGYDASDNPIYADLDVIERYELRDNNIEWEGGKRYNYDIIFKTSADDQHTSIEIVPTTFSIVYGNDNPGMTSGAYGNLRIKIEDGEGNVTYKAFEAPTFVLPPLHDQGSPFQDEMDYRDGGIIF